MLELVSYWCSVWRVWVLIVLDENGDQRFPADYFPHRAALEAAMKGA